MKKILLFASAVALLASCTKQDVTPGEEVNSTKGISFQAQVGNDTKAEWTEAEGQFNMFWYSEADKIDVYFQNAELAGTPSDEVDTWAKTEVGIYKATRSMNNGLFTAKNDENLLTFIRPAVEAEKAAFFAVWPSGTTVDDGGVAGASLKFTLPKIAAQNQVEVNGSSTIANMFMYSEQLGVVPAADYEAVADRLALKFVRPYTALYFKVANYEKNSTVYGVLKSIKVTALGEVESVDPATGVKSYKTNTQSKIDYGTATFDSKEKKIKPSTQTSTITLKFNGEDGLAWKDNAIAYMAMDNVKRTAAEDVEIVYSFKNATITKVVSTSANWPATAGNFVAAPVLDLDNEDFVLTTDKAKLVVNKGTFKAAYDVATSKGTSLTTLTTIVSKIALTAEEMKLMPGLLALTEVTLMENTEVPSETFTQTGFTTINMPKVATIADDGFGTQTALENLVLPAYKFDNADVNTALIVKSKLKTLDMSSVESTVLEFNSNALSLKGFTLLESVTVKNGLVVGANTFDGCRALKTVAFPKAAANGAVTISGNSAFKDCVALTAISINNTDIPANTFDGCTVLATTLQNGVAKSMLQPTSVGVSAFKGCAALVSIDLTKATTIGAGAFENATALTGVSGVLIASELTTLENGTFSGCTGLKKASFPSVTKIGDDAFKSVALAQLSFGKPFVSTSATTVPSADTFGTTTNTILFLSKAQTGMSGNTLTLKSVDGKTEKEYTFSSIN